MVTEEQVRPLWKCLVEGCNYTGPPTVKGYKKLSGHQLAHIDLPKAKRGFHLVNESTGEVLAVKLEEAITKGFIVAEPTAPVSPPETKPPPLEKPLAEVKPETKPTAKEPRKATKEKEEITEPVISPDGIFAYTIHLPADAFTLFNLSKFSRLEKDVDKPFDEWIWDCVIKRFEKDYGMQLVLAPIKEEEKHG